MLSDGQISEIVRVCGTVEIEPVLTEIEQCLTEIEQFLETQHASDPFPGEKIAVRSRIR